MRKSEMQQQKLPWRIFYYIGFIVVVALLMMCLMWSVYQIPVYKIRENAKSSVSIFDLTPKPTEVVDIATDARMLNEAAFLGISDKDFLLNPRIHYVEFPLFSLDISMDKTGWERLNIKKLPRFIYQNIWTRPEGKVWVDFYPRFWHGYLLFLKPLLMFFDLQGIRYINLLFQCGLLCAILYLMYKRLGFKHCVAFVTAMCFLNPITSWMCLEYANVVNVMLLATLWVLLNKNPDDKYMFFVIGAGTILFDFLTFPLVTLGVPLIVYISLYERGFEGDVKCVIKNSFLWLFGYAGMLFSKWVLATLFTDYDVLEDGWQNILHRLYGTTENGGYLLDVTIFSSIMFNLRAFFYTSSVYYLGVFVFFIGGILLFKKCKIKGNLGGLVLFFVGLMPFFWYSVLVNHSIIHSYLFTHKILVITVYAILSAIVCCFENKK